jgi:hypothetical protein
MGNSLELSNGETSELVGKKLPFGKELPFGNSQYKGIAYNLNRDKLSLFFIRQFFIIFNRIFKEEK